MTALEYGFKIFQEMNSNAYVSDTPVILEFGVYKGHTLSRLVEMVESCDWGIHQPYIAGFDSFEGLPHDWPGTVCQKGAFSLGGEMPNVPGATLYKGWFEDTIPEFLRTRFNTCQVELLHLDADLYSSTTTVLEGLNNLIGHGTVIVCDEWTYNFDQKLTDQEQKAVWDWAQKFDRFIVPLDYVDPTVEETNGLHVGGERKVLLVVR